MGLSMVGKPEFVLGIQYLVEAKVMTATFPF